LQLPAVHTEKYRPDAIINLKILAVGKLLIVRASIDEDCIYGLACCAGISNSIPEHIDPTEYLVHMLSVQVLETIDTHSGGLQSLRTPLGHNELGITGAEASWALFGQAAAKTSVQRYTALALWWSGVAD